MAVTRCRTVARDVTRRGGTGRPLRRRIHRGLRGGNYNAKARRGVHGRGGQVQAFSYGPLEFNVNRALILAANRRKYRRSGAGPIRTGSAVHRDRPGSCGAMRPVAADPLATLTLPGHPRAADRRQSRAAHALKYGKDVRAIVLDLEDTLRVMTPRRPDPGNERKPAPGLLPLERPQPAADAAPLALVSAAVSNSEARLLPSRKRGKTARQEPRPPATGRLLDDGREIVADSCNDAGTGV